MSGGVLYEGENWGVNVRWSENIKRRGRGKECQKGKYGFFA